MKTNLTEEEKKRIIAALNNNVEPPPELMTKLFPRLAEKFDVAKLDRAKIVTLEYAGKRSEAAILNQASPTDAGSPLQLERYFKGGSLTGQTQLDMFEQAKKDETDDNWQNLVVQGDNLQFLKTCYRNADPLIKDRVKGKVKLIYIDPPFATKSDFKGSKDEKSYSDKVDSAEFIEGLRERLIYLRDILAVDGSIYVHCDYRLNSYIRIIMDEVFGNANFRNEIYARRKIKNIQSQFEQVRQLNTAVDTILWYSKNPEKRFKIPTKASTTETNYEQWNNFYNNQDRPTLRYTLLGISLEKGQWRWKKEKAELAVKNYFEFKEKYSKEMSLYEYWLKTGKEKRFIKREPGSTRCYYWIPPKEIVNVDSYWGDIYAYDNSPGYYPTQKSEILLERIITSHSNANDLILDVFAGSGTTAAVAEKLGRRWIVCDFGKHAIYTMQKRMLKIGESKALGNDVKKNRKYDKPPKPFCVVSTGAYDFSRIMKLRENMDAYVDFVLGLFQIGRDEKDLSGKFSLTNILGEKDGDPVEVYPVWNDEYLKNIRIDEGYLKGIIVQSGGKLKGNYYIITPETCTLTGDTAMKNSAGDEVHFKLLKFPYKILEDVSRNFQIQEQPSSQDNVNNLISSTGFYFNDSVEIEVERTKQGLKITRFETKILDKQEERLEGLDGLAMLLVDIDYDGELFDMDRTVFAKDIGSGSEIQITGLTESVAVIAIDRHGNESKPFVIKE